MAQQFIIELKYLEELNSSPFIFFSIPNSNGCTVFKKKKSLKVILDFKLLQPYNPYILIVCFQNHWMNVVCIHICIVHDSSQHHTWKRDRDASNWRLMCVYTHKSIILKFKQNGPISEHNFSAPFSLTKLEFVILLKRI